VAEAITSSRQLVSNSKLLSKRLNNAGKKLVATEFFRRLAATIALGLLLFSLALLFDWFAELSLTNRQILLTAIAAVAGGHVIWTLASLVTQKRSQEEVALMVEKDHPDFDSRLISAVQFAAGKAAVPANAPSAMVRAMVVETEREARRFQFGNIVDRRKMARAILLLIGIIVLAGSGGAIIGKQNLEILLARAFGATTPIPHETKIIQAPGEMRVGIGDTVELNFTAQSIADGVALPEEGELSVDYINGRNETLLLERKRTDAEKYTLASDKSNNTIEPVPIHDAAATGAYSVTIADIQESFHFQATINDARTGNIKVTALERPRVASIKGTQTYPSFTGNAPTAHAPGDFTLFPGGELTLEITSTKDLSGAALHLIGANTQIPVKIDSADPRISTVQFTVPPEKLSGFSLSLTDTEEMQSRDDVVYRVLLLADRAPEIRITHPKRAEEMATRNARFLIHYEATDRFGIASMNLRYRRGSAEPESLPISIPKNTPKSVNGQLDWDLTKLQPGLTEGDVLEYWLEATDQNAASANTGSSEHLLVRIVTPEEKRADLLGRASDALGTVSEATTDQERLNKDLETVIRSNISKKRAPPKQD
jgi:hypothetical protein